MKGIKFNEHQIEAITTTYPYTRVIAGAGTGKTQVVSARIKYFLENGAKGNEICAITFSKNAANEIVSRAEKTIGYKVPGLTGTTFNALENEIALDNWEKFGYRHRMSVIDDVQDLPMCDCLLRRHPIYEWVGPSFTNYTQTKSFIFPSALRIISDVLHEVERNLIYKDFKDINSNDVKGVLDDTAINLTPNIINKIIALYPEYEKMKKGMDPEFTAPVITFDEQVSLCMRVLNDDPDYLDNHYNFAHIIVDEAQDTSKEQIEFLNKLINMKKFKTLTVVGDDSQAIYESLMKTSPDYLINLDDYLYHIDENGNHKRIEIRDVVMDINYRSQKEIIDLANKIIDKNKNKIQKTLIASKPSTIKPSFKGFSRNYDEKMSKSKLTKGIKESSLKKGECDEIARDIKVLIDKGVDPDKIAFLAYSKNELKNIADKLTKLGVPSKFGAPEYLKENSRILAILSFVKLLITNTEDVNNYHLEIANALFDGELMEENEDVIKSGINYVVDYVKKIKNAEFDEKKTYFLEFIDEIAHGDEAVINFKDKFKDMDYEEIITYCDNFDVFGDNMQFKRSTFASGVMLITAHSAKGLEWDYVFGSLTGLEKRKLSAREEEEIRRLLFVMITRAKEELYLYGQYKAYGSIGENVVLNKYVMEVCDALDIAYNPIY